MEYRKQKPTRTNDVRGDLINKNKRDAPEDVKKLLELYLNDKKIFWTGEPLNKTRTDLVLYYRRIDTSV